MINSAKRAKIKSGILMGKRRNTLIKNILKIPKR